MLAKVLANQRETPKSLLELWKPGSSLASRAIIML